MPAEVRYADAAQADLASIYLTIAADAGPDRANRYVSRITAACELLAGFPRRGAPRDDLAPGLRILAIARRVVVGYFVDDDGVLIARVLYGGRDLAGALAR